jgi:hypothetical protein
LIRHAWGGPRLLGTVPLGIHTEGARPWITRGIGTFQGGYKMLVAVSLLGGILLAASILATHRQASTVIGPSQKATPLAWWTLAFGLVEILTLGIGWLLPMSIARWTSSVAFAFAGAAVVLGVVTLWRKDRHWPTWLGLVLGLAPAVFLCVFTAAYTFYTLSGE